MPSCPSCSHDVPEGSRFCPGCARPLEDGGATRTSLSGADPAPSSFPSSPSGGRFLPGSMIANRYRVVGLLGIGVGRGGGVVGVSMMLLVALVLLRLLVRDSRVAVGSRINTMNPAEWAGTSSVISLVALLIVAAIAATIASGGRGWLQDEV